MIPLSSRRLPLCSLPILGCACGVYLVGALGAFPSRAIAQDAAPTPTVAAPLPVTGQPDANGNEPRNESGRHLAPHDTFYLLSYVSAPTKDGVDGFVPGQEVHLVAVHRPTHTLVVTDGRAEVEVPPSKLTNDLDVAAQAREKDEAHQAGVAAYVQAQEATYAKHQQEEATAALKQDEHDAQVQATAQADSSVQAATLAPAQPIDASVGASTYYGDGGYGYGTPYSYFFEGTTGPRRTGFGASGPGGSRGTLPSDNAGGATRVEGGAAGGAEHGGGGGAEHGGGGGAEHGGGGAAGGGHTGGGGGRP